MSNQQLAPVPARKIVVVQQGWVLVGHIVDKGTSLLVTEASVVRKWGTTAGLGEIALHGPTAETVLDFCGKTDVPKLAVLFTIDCVEEKWAAYEARKK